MRDAKYDAVHNHLLEASVLLDRPGDKTARDWAAFFAALAAMMTQILPIIIPLFMVTEEKEKS